MSSDGKAFEGSEGRLGLEPIITGEKRFQIPVIVVDETDEVLAREKAIAFIETTFPGSEYDGAILETMETRSRGGLTNRIGYEFRANFKDIDFVDTVLGVGDFKISFDSTGASQRQHWSDPADVDESNFDPAADQKKKFGAINAPKLEPEGADVVIPQQRMQVDRKYDRSDISGAYLYNATAITGSVNNAPFLGWAAGTCLFLGFRTTLEEFSAPVITFAFDVRVDRMIKIGAIPEFPLKAHQYVWVRYYTDRDDSDPTLAVGAIEKPVQAYIHDIYKEADFGTLGIDSDPNVLNFLSPFPS